VPFVLNNAATADAYSDANTLACPGTVKLFIAVFNNGIFYQRALPGPGVVQSGGQYGPEVFLAPGLYSFIRRCEAVRVRSSAAGSSASVTIEALVPSD